MEAGDRSGVALSSVSAMRMPSCSQPSRTLRAAYSDALRASWTAAARDGVGARRSGRQDGRLDRTQDGRCGRWFRRWTIRRLEVDSPTTRVPVVDVSASLLLGQQILQLAAVTDPDFFPQLVEHLPNGKRLLGRPGDGDFNRDRTQMIGHCAHGLAPRRLRARASARSRASLSR